MTALHDKNNNPINEFIITTDRLRSEQWKDKVTALDVLLQQVIHVASSSTTSVHANATAAVKPLKSQIKTSNRSWHEQPNEVRRLGPPLRKFLRDPRSQLIKEVCHRLQLLFAPSSGDDGYDDYYIPPNAVRYLLKTSLLDDFLHLNGQTNRVIQQVATDTMLKIIGKVMFRREMSMIILEAYHSHRSRDVRAACVLYVTHGMKLWPKNYWASATVVTSGEMDDFVRKALTDSASNVRENAKLLFLTYYRKLQALAMNLYGKIRERDMRLYRSLTELIQTAAESESGENDLGAGDNNFNDESETFSVSSRASSAVFSVASSTRTPRSSNVSPEQRRSPRRNSKLLPPRTTIPLAKNGVKISANETGEIAKRETNLETPHTQTNPFSFMSPESWDNAKMARDPDTTTIDTKIKGSGIVPPTRSPKVSVEVAMADEVKRAIQSEIRSSQKTQVVDNSYKTPLTDKEELSVSSSSSAKSLNNELVMDLSRILSPAVLSTKDQFYSSQARRRASSLAFKRRVSTLASSKKNGSNANESIEEVLIEDCGDVNEAPAGSVLLAVGEELVNAHKKYLQELGEIFNEQQNLMKEFEKTLDSNFVNGDDQILITYFLKIQENLANHERLNKELDLELLNISGSE